MEIAVFSDIHGNYEAFRECLKYALERNIDTFIFLGDYLGEFPYPQKTMEMIYSLSEKYICYFVRGNKEDYWISRRYDNDCVWRNGNSTVGAMKYCFANQTEKDIEFFKGLSTCQEIALEGATPILACHGSPNRNNEKMLLDYEKTKSMIDECPYKYILCGHTHVQGGAKYGDKIVLNPGAVGVSLHGGGKAQFMILRQNMREWEYDFISLDYDKEKVIKEMYASGLDEMAPYWDMVTKHLIYTGEVSHGTVLSKAMELCKDENGKCEWYDVPEKYWEKAIEELLGLG